MNDGLRVLAAVRRAAALLYTAALLCAAAAAGAQAEAARISTALMSQGLYLPNGPGTDLALSINLDALPPRPVTDARLRIVPLDEAPQRDAPQPDSIEIFVLEPRWSLTVPCSRYRAGIECGGPELAQALESTRKFIGLSFGLRVRVPGTWARRAYGGAMQGPLWQRPRLIVSWADADPGADAAAAAARAGRNDQTALQFPGADGAVATALRLDLRSIVAGPVFRRGEILLLGQRRAPSAPIELHRIDRDGGSSRKPWPLPAATWTHLLYDDERDVLLAFARTEIQVIGDLGEAVPRRVRRKEGGYDLSTHPVLTAGGAVMLSDDRGPRTLALGPAPTLTPLWDSDDWLDPFTQIVVGPRHGEPLAYAFDQRGLKVMDALRGAVPERSGGPPRFAEDAAGDLRSRPGRRVPAPLVVEAMDSLHVFVAMRRDDGTVLFDHSCIGAACPAGTWRELGSGPVNGCIAPVAPPGPRALVCILGEPGYLRIHDIATGQPKCENKEQPLGTTTNPVADGAGHVYVLDIDGTLRGFDRECRLRFQAALDFDGDKINRLWAAPDGGFFLTSERRIFAVRFTQSTHAPAQAK